MNVGDLSITISTNVARIQKEMAEIKGSISTAMKDVEQYVGYAKTAFIGFAGVSSVSAFKGMIDGAIEGKAKLYDLSLQTGISVEALSALGKVAKYSNTELGDIAGASNKLSKALYAQNEDSKGAAQTIKALGLNFTEFKSLGADQQMLAVAKAMDGFADGTGKSAGAMLLFGKTGAQLLPFLKELAEKNELVGKQTTASALEAKRYEDNLISLKAAGQEWKNTLVTDMLPYLVQFTDKLVDSRKAYGGWIAALSAGNVDTSGGLGDAFKKNADSLIAAQKRVDEATARQGKPKTGFFSGFDLSDSTVMATLNADLEKQMARRKFLLLQQERADKGSFDRIDTMLGGRPKPKLGVDGGGGGGGGAIKELADGYEALMQKLRTKIDLDQQEIALGRQLSDSEKLQIDVYNEVEKNFQKLSIAKMLSIDETLQMALALGKERQAQEANLKWMKEAADANGNYIEGRMQLRDQMQQERKDAELMLSQYGLTTDELRAMESARLRDAAAALERKSVLAEDVDLTGQLTQLYRDQAEALRGTAEARDLLTAKEAKDRNDPLAGANRAVREYLLDVKRAGDATYGAVANAVKGLEDLTVTALMGGDAKSAAKAWVNGILSEVYRLNVVKPLFAALFGKDALGGGGGLGGLADIIRGLFGGGGGGGGGFGGAGSGGDGYAGFAKGDVFDSATPFRFASGGAFKRGIMGEAGPEAVMPLTRGSDGKLGVAAQGGGSRQVMVNVINNGAPVQARSSQRETSEGTVIELVLNAVAADMAGGGKVHDATQRRFGLNPGGSTPRY